MMRKISIAVLLSTGIALAASGVRIPIIGFPLDAAGNLRPLLGVRGNLLHERPLLTGVISASISTNGGLAKKKDSLLLLDRDGAAVRQIAAPAGHAVFGLSASGNFASAWFPDERLLWMGDAAAFRTVPVRFDGEVVGMALTPRLVLLVEREGGIWRLELSGRDGSVRSETLLPLVQRPLLMLPDGRLIYSGPKSLTLREPAGSEIEIPAPVPVESMQLAGKAAVILRCANRSLLLRFDATGETLEFIPEGR